MGLMAIVEQARKFFRVTGAALLLTGCTPEQPKPIAKPPIVREAPPPPDQTQAVLMRIHQEVRRLVQFYPEDSIIRRVYLGNLSAISPVFVGTLPVGIADPKAAYARTEFAQAEYTSMHRFRYFLPRDQSLKDYATLKAQKVAIYFSPLWLNSKNDAVKILALEKEAYTVALWEPFGRIMLNTYLAQGIIERIDPAVTEAEIARTLARQIPIENPAVRKLYDYAGYLPLLAKVGQILAMQNPQVTTELAYSNFPEIYRLAKQRGIQFEGLQFGSREFLQLAFDTRGPWVKLILQPSIPGPIPLP